MSKLEDDKKYLDWLKIFHGRQRLKGKLEDRPDLGGDILEIVDVYLDAMGKEQAKYAIELMKYLKERSIPLGQISPMQMIESRAKERKLLAKRISWVTRELGSLRRKIEKGSRLGEAFIPIADLREIEKKYNSRNSLTVQNVEQHSYTINDIDQLSGHDFENFLGQLFTQLGYDATVTKRSGDQGIDLMLTKAGEVIVVQAKRYNSSVGNDAVQEVISGKAYTKANKALVITNSTFTSSARDLASHTDTILWDRSVLNALLQLLY